MPSYTKEQREHALEVLRQCDGRVTQAITRLGYPSRQTMYQWIRGETAATVRTAGRPFSQYDATGDPGRRYRWPGWISVCERHGPIRPMSAKGCSPDS